MKKILVMLGVISTSVALVGCSNNDNDEEKSTRFKNVSIIEATQKWNGEYRHGGIEISIDAFSSNASIYTMIVEHGEEAPTNKQIKAGEKYGSKDIIGAYTSTGSLYEFVHDEEFVEGETYDCYAVIENSGSFSSITYKTTVFTYTGEDLVDRGVGTKLDPYKISTIEELEAVGYVTSKRTNAEEAYYILENNIDLSEKYNQEAYDAFAEENNGEYRDGYGSWLPLGQQTGSRRKFYGEFDGQGFTINGLFQRSAIEGTGLFSELDAAGTIKNVVMTNVDIHTTTQRTAAVCGYSKGTINNCVVLGGSITSTANRLGGISGQMYEAGHIIGCYVDTTISTTGGDVGGIVGGTTAGALTLTVNYCQFAGSVSGGSDVGGIGGDISGTNVKFNSVYDAYISGSSNTAGVVGKYSVGSTDNSKTASMEYCFIINSTVNSNSSKGAVTRNFASAATSNGLYYANVTFSGTGSTSNGSNNTSSNVTTILSYEFITTSVYFSPGLYEIVDGQMPILKLAYTNLTYNEFYPKEVN